MDLTTTTVRLYAEDMITFFMREYEIEWRPTIEAECYFARFVSVRFDCAVGRVMINNAKVIWKKEIERLAPLVLDAINSEDDLMNSGKMYACNLFERVGFSPFSVLKVFTFIIEIAIRYYKRNTILANAPELAVRFISGILISPEGLYVVLCRLNALNDMAKNMLTDKENREKITSDNSSSRDSESSESYDGFRRRLLTPSQRRSTMKYTEFIKTRLYLKQRK